VVGYGVEEEDRKHTWMEDSEAVSSALFISSHFSQFLMSESDLACDHDQHLCSTGDH